MSISQGIWSTDVSSDKRHNGFSVMVNGVDSDQSRKRIAFVEKFNCKTWDEVTDNANLIAAAPDLLAALKEMLAWANPGNIGGVEACDMANDAIGMSHSNKISPEVQAKMDSHAHKFFSGFIDVESEKNVLEYCNQKNAEISRLRSLNKELVEALDWALVEGRHIFKGNYYAKKYAELVIRASDGMKTKSKETPCTT